MFSSKLLGQFENIVADVVLQIIAAEREIQRCLDIAELVADIVSLASEDAGIALPLLKAELDGIRQLDFPADALGRTIKNIEDFRRKHIAAKNGNVRRGKGRIFGLLDHVGHLEHLSVRLVKEEKYKEVEGKAAASVEKIILPVLIGIKGREMPEGTDAKEIQQAALEAYRNGEMDDYVIEIEMVENPKPQQLMPGSGVEINIGEMLGGILPKRKKKRKLTVKKARELLMMAESEKLIDMENVNSEAIERAENEGIIFIDEIDKITARGNSSGPDVSREGVQRDILPIVEGCTVNTKYGIIRTDFILFIAAGAFHIAKVSDLIPELQGRFPILVKLDSLGKEDFKRILTQTDNAILKQYTELLRVDNVELKFTAEAIELIAEIAVNENDNNEDIGARRLHTIMENLLEDISFNAGNLTSTVEVVVDRHYVETHLESSIKAQNLKKYIL